MTDWVKQAQSSGRRVALSQRLFSTEGIALVVVTMAEDVAALDKIRQENAASADFAARAAKLAAISAEPVRTVVLERIVDPPAGATGVGTTIGQMASFYPRVGSGPAVRRTLEGFTRDRQGAGARLTLWQRIFSSDGPSFAILGRYNDLSELDRQRKDAAQAIGALGTALAELIRQPTQVRVFETIVPLPPQ